MTVIYISLRAPHTEMPHKIGVDMLYANFEQYLTNGVIVCDRFICLPEASSQFHNQT